MKFFVQLPAHYNKQQIEAAGHSVDLVNKELIIEAKTENEAVQIAKEFDLTLKVIGRDGITKKAISDTDKAIVQTKVREGVDISKFGFYEGVLCDTYIDFSRDKLTLKFLQALADQANKGISFLVNHSPNAVVGSIYAGFVRTVANDPENSELVIKFYIPEDSTLPNGGNAQRGIDTGIWKFISVSFRGYDVRTESSADNYVTIYDARNEYPAPIFIEASLVYRGDQPRAEVLKEIGAMVSGYTAKCFSSAVKQKVNMSVKKDFTHVGPTGEKAVIQISVDGEAFQGDAILQSALDQKDATIKSLSDEIKGLKEPMINEIQALQKKLKHPEDDTNYLLTLTPAKIADRLGIMKALDLEKNKQNQIPGGNGDQPKKNKYVS